MAIATGARLGPYEILSTVGAGGMGEVYRARDTRLGRDVAIKVLPQSFASDAQRLRRFEQEARAIAALNHPNILAVHDIGTQDGIPYIVTELLEGRTLREQLSDGPVPVRKALDYAKQVSAGLAAAHSRGIVHRDLKPENVFCIRDGLVKILDFGLAKQTLAPAAHAATMAGETMPDVQTEPGLVMGTVGYMSPEQVRGAVADQRSDLFSLGAILYEMLSGQRAFKRDTNAETMTAILKEEPPELTGTNPAIAPGLERIVRRCLEKEPTQRFQSASDLGFAIEALSDTAKSVAAPATVSRSGRWRIAAIAALALVALVAGWFARSATLAPRSSPRFHQITFRRGLVRMARFAPDGQTIVYSASWQGNPVEVFSTSSGSVASRSLGLHGAEILSISPAGEMAVLLGSHQSQSWIYTGTLARVALAGGEPREILEDVQWADWAPNGETLAVVRNVGGMGRLEFPIGKVLYETAGWISYPRISPKGDRIAFLDHPLPGDNAGSVMVVDLTGSKRTLSSNSPAIQGLAWSPNGQEIWFTVVGVGNALGLYAVTLAGQQRLITRIPGAVTLHDIGPDGRLLLGHENWRREVTALSAGDDRERDLTWLDWTVPADLSPDGKNLLFDEEGEGGGAAYSVYLRKVDGTAAVRLGDGRSQALSPDQKWVLTSRLSSPTQLVLLPTKAGEPKPLTHDAINHFYARWFPDGKRIVFSGAEPDHGVRLYVQDLAGGRPQAISPEGVDALWLWPSPDGNLVAAIGPDQRGYFYPVAGGQPRPIANLGVGDLPIGWSADGRSLYVVQSGEMPALVYRLELATGHKTLWKRLMPSDPAGVNIVFPILFAPDGKSYVYGYRRILSDLYLVEGLK